VSSGQSTVGEWPTKFFRIETHLHTRFAQVAKIAKALRQAPASAQGYGGHAGQGGEKWGVYFAPARGTKINATTPLRNSWCIIQPTRGGGAIPMPFSSYSFKKPRPYSQFGTPECE